MTLTPVIWDLYNLWRSEITLGKWDVKAYTVLWKTLTYSLKFKNPAVLGFFRCEALCWKPGVMSPSCWSEVSSGVTHLLIQGYPGSHVLVVAWILRIHWNGVCALKDLLFHRDSVMRTVGPQWRGSHRENHALPQLIQGRSDASLTSLTQREESSERSLEPLHLHLTTHASVQHTRQEKKCILGKGNSMQEGMGRQKTAKSLWGTVWYLVGWEKWDFSKRLFSLCFLEKSAKHCHI